MTLSTKLSYLSKNIWQTVWLINIFRKKTQPYAESQLQLTLTTSPFAWSPGADSFHGLKPRSRSPIGLTVLPVLSQNAQLPPSSLVLIPKLLLNLMLSLAPLPTNSQLSPSCGSLENETIVQGAHRIHPDHGTGPPNCLFVSQEVCFQLLQWGRSSKLTCHPGVQMST